MTRLDSPRLFRRAAMCGAAFAFGLAALAGRASADVAHLAPKGELLLDADFSAREVYPAERVVLQPGWQVRAAHGIWTRTAEGIQSRATPGHQPVLVLEGGQLTDVIVELEFRYQAEAGEWSACRISVANPSQHPKAYVASVWANVDHDARATGLVLEHDQWSQHVTQVARKAVELTPGVWHTLRLEIVGPRALASVDGMSVTGEYPAFKLPKTSVWIATGRSPHEIRRVRVYAVRPEATAARPGGPNVTD